MPVAAFVKDVNNRERNYKKVTWFGKQKDHQGAGTKLHSVRQKSKTQKSRALERGGVGGTKFTVNLSRGKKQKRGLDQGKKKIVLKASEKNKPQRKNSKTTGLRKEKEDPKSTKKAAREKKE